MKECTVMTQDTPNINSNTTVERVISFLPLITEESGDRVVNLLISITIQDKHHKKFSYETDIEVQIYDKEKMKVIEGRGKRFRFADATNTGNFEVQLVHYDKLRAVHTEKLQVRVSTKVYAKDMSDEFVYVE